MIDENLVGTVRRRLERNERVRRTLPDGGRINIERQLPFLIVYRPPPDRPDAGTRDFVRSEASYLMAPSRRSPAAVRRLGRAVVETLSPVFGGFLLVEVWAGPATGTRPEDDGTPQPPGFRVVAPRRFADSGTVSTLVRALRRIQLFKRPAEVELVVGGRVGARGMGPLVQAKDLAELGANVIGIEVRPVYRNAETGEPYPIAERHLARQLSRAMREACFEFARKETSHRPRHYQALGQRAFTKAAWEIDAELASISQAFDLLLYVTPTNTEQAWRGFRRSGYERVPPFLYRPRDFDPDVLKRRLHAVDVDRVEDPTLAFVFREKRGDLDLKLSLLGAREHPRFLPISVALYGSIGEELRSTARGLLEQLPPGGRTRVRAVPPPQVAARAREELERYRRAYPPLDSEVQVRDDVSSLMVSQGDLLVPRLLSVPSNRLDSLLQHEVGTHVVTHWNGRAQPFRLLSVGLARYDELQEGLAVFAEHLSGGLTPARMRTLAARVLSADHVAQGAELVDVWRDLHRTWGFGERPAFQIAMRVLRGGGFVKDSVYLRGLQAVLDYLADGGHLETLLVGKIATEHAPIVEELQRRGVLNPSPLRPVYLDDPDGRLRVGHARSGTELLELVER